MSELAPCPGCRRHVATHERACPFCKRVLPPLRAQRVALAGRVSRAAVFSAALAACSGDKQPPAPAAPPAQGSDDLEQLLDNDGREVAHPDPLPPSDAAIEPVADAAVDAGVPDAAVVKKMKVRKQHVRDVQQELDRVRIHTAKPYGAPPARRRIV
jgi:hypothetical protein